MAVLDCQTALRLSAAPAKAIHDRATRGSVQGSRYPVTSLSVVGLASAVRTDLRRAARTSSVVVAAATAGSRNRATPCTGHESNITALTRARLLPLSSPRPHPPHK